MVTSSAVIGTVRVFRGLCHELDFTACKLFRLWLLSLFRWSPPVMQISQAVQPVHLFCWKGRGGKTALTCTLEGRYAKPVEGFWGGSCGVFYSSVYYTLLSVISWWIMNNSNSMLRDMKSGSLYYNMCVNRSHHQNLFSHGLVQLLPGGRSLQLSL